MALTRVSGNLIASGVSLTFDAGNAAFPALTTTGDTNTGIFFPAADNVATSVAGTEGMRLTSTGLGIGTSSPSQKLSVNSGSTQTAASFTSTSTAVFYALLNSGSQVFIGNDSTSGSFVIQTPSGGYSTKLTVDNAGGLKILNTIGVGNATPSSNGAGITFPATQSASSDANTLDDYEEGTWTPTIYGTSTAGTTTYFQQAGTYTKVGRVVTVQVFLNITNQTGTGSLQLGGLPFTSGSGGNTFPCSVRAENLALTAGKYPVFSVAGNATYINMEETATGGGAIFGIGIDTSFSVDVTATYFV